MGLFWNRSQGDGQRSALAPIWAGLPTNLQHRSNFATVDPASFAGSLQSVAIGSTVDLICSLGSELPIDVYRGEGADRTKIKAPSYFADIAGDGHGTADWVYQVLQSWAMRGNLYGQILERASSGYPTQAGLYFPDLVSLTDIMGDLTWYANGQEVTDVYNFLHRRVMPATGTVLGMSPIANHASTIGISLSATQFGRQWFTDGAHPSALLTSEQDLDEAKATTAKSRFVSALRGKREPLVLGNGWKYQAIQINPEESQFLQTQGYSEAQCARIFGPGFAEILGYESGGNLTYANIESRATHLLVFGMNKWLSRVDRLLTEFLPNPQYARINRDAMLESTTLTRYQAHALALQNDWKVINEVRADEDMGPVPWGDEPLAKSVPATPVPAPPQTDPAKEA